MLRPIALLTLLALVSCNNTPINPLTALEPTKPLTPGPEHEDAPKPLVKPRTTPFLHTPPPPPPRFLTLAYHHTSSNGVKLSLVSFDDRHHRLRVADQPNGPGSRWDNSKSAATSFRGFAAINGGFFTPEGKPLGLLIENGTRRGHINKSPLGTGIYISASSGSAIIRREHLATSSLAAKARNLLQTGPMLVENGKPVTALSKTSHRPRSFIAWDGKHHWAIGHTTASTLDALSRALAGNSPAGFNIHTAINLDGGRSSDLWVGPQVKNGNKTHRSLFNKTVRNYLVLTTR